MRTLTIKVTTPDRRFLTELIARNAEILTAEPQAIIEVTLTKAEEIE